MIRLLIADDHKIFRKGLRQTIEDNSGMTVTGEATNGNEVLDLLSKHHFDVVILDLSMPGPSGLDILKQIRENQPKMPVIILSMHPEEQYALRVMKAGAAGYLTKETDEEDLIAAIRKAYRGGKYITPSLAEKLAFAVEVDFEHSTHEKLSDREFQVMRMIGQGSSISEIASKLSLSVSTVSTYRTRILEKTGLRNSAAITRYVIKNRLID